MLFGEVVLQGHSYLFRGYESNSTLYFRLFTKSVEGINFLDAGLYAKVGRQDVERNDLREFSNWYIDDETKYTDFTKYGKAVKRNIPTDPNALANSRFGAGIDLELTGTALKVNVETHLVPVEGESESKKFTSRMNKDVLRALGSLIRGIRNQATPSNAVLTSAVVDGNFSSDQVYEYEVERGSVSLKQFMIVSLEGEDPESGISIAIREESSLPFKKMYKISPVSSTRLNLEWYAPSVDESMFVAVNGLYTVDQIKQMHPERSYAWLDDRDYRIASPDNFAQLVNYLMEYRLRDENTGELLLDANGNAMQGVVSFDTETTGLGFTFRTPSGVGDKLVGMVFSVREGEAIYFPLRHRSFPNICSESEITEVLHQYFKPLLTQKPLLAHNAEFDWRVMYSEGIDCNIVADTMVLFDVTLSNDNPRLSSSLKGLTRELLFRDAFELVDFTPSKTVDFSFQDMPYESTRYYACADTDNTLALYNYAMRNKLIERYQVQTIFNLECALTPVIGYNHYYGMYAKGEEISAYEQELNTRKEKALASMCDLIGMSFNPSSSTELAHVLFDVLGHKPPFLTPKGAPSTKAEALDKLEEEVSFLSDEVRQNLPKKYKFIEFLREYRFCEKLLSNFIKAYREKAVGGFIHSKTRPRLNTGRMAVGEPNYQSFDDNAKRYIRPRENYYMVDSDFSSIESRLMASIAGEQTMVERFFDPEFDFHRGTASLVFNVPYEDVTKDMRSKSKVMGFGIPYGMSASGMALRMWGDESRASEAQVLIDKYMNSMPKIKAMFETTRASAVRDLYNTTFFGRRRTYSRTDNRGKIERAAGNLPIQGTAADIFKIAMVRLFNKLREKDYLGKVLITAFVHDEVVLEVHKSINPFEILGIVREALMVPMEREGWCPLYIGAGFGDCWKTAKSVEIPVNLQTEFIERKELDWWDGDTERLMKYMEVEINTYSVTFLKNYLADPENHNKELSLVAMGYLKAVLEMIQKHKPIRDLPESAYATPLDFSSPLSELQSFADVFDCHELVSSAGILAPGETPQLTDTTAFSQSVSTPEQLQHSLQRDLSTLLSQTALTGAVVSDDSSQVFVYLPPCGGEVWNELGTLLASYPGSSSVVGVYGNGHHEVIPNASVSPAVVQPLLNYYRVNRHRWAEFEVPHL